jgi:hypothetical protein
MAFNQRIAIEVDAATGNDANGGGFDDTTGVPGTNYAWGAGQTTIAYTDIASVGAGAVATSVGRSFVAADVGNILNLTGGTNVTTGRYQILSVASGQATLDRSFCTGAAAGGTGTLGGSLASIQKGLDVAFINAGAVADCRLYIKKGTYTGTVALITTGSVGASGRRCRITGYNTTHDDDPTPQSGNQPSYAVGSGAGVNGITLSTASGFWVQNVTFDGTAASGTQGVIGINAAIGSVTTVNVKIKNFSSNGWTTNNGFNPVLYSEITGCAGIAVNFNSSALALGCWIHKNTNVGVTSGSGFWVVNCLITNNSGASSDGIQFSAGTAFFALGNTIYGNGRDGINDSGTNIHASGPVYTNNILAKNGRYGINVQAAQLPLRFVGSNYNAFYSNTTADRNNILAGDNDAVVSANPFVSSDTDLAAETNPDWSLNNTMNAGAALRAAGFPGQMPGLTTPAGKRDIGVYQHLDNARPRNPLMVGMGAALQGGVY